MPPAAIMAMAAGVGVFSSASSSLAMYQQGQYARTASIRQNEALQIQSQEVQQQAGSKIAVDDYRAAHLLSRINAVTSASGITTEGSPSAIFESSAEEAKINDMYTKYAANLQSSQLKYQGDLLKSQGEEEAKAATIGAITGFTANAAELGLTYEVGKQGSITQGIFNNGLGGFSDPLQTSY